MINYLAAEVTETGSSSVIIVAAITGVLALMGTIFGGWYTYRAAKENAKATREVEQDKLSTASWESQVEQWRTDVVELRRQRAEDRLEHETHRKECAQQIERLSSQIREVMDAHEADRREHRRERYELERRVNDLASWGHEVIIIMRHRGISFPIPPGDILDNNADESS